MKEFYEELKKLTDEELFNISLEKDKKNCATKRALVAQRIIWERAKCPFQSSSNYARNHTYVRSL